MKIIGLMKKKAGLSDEEFRTYYETNHVPLAMRLTPFFSGYTRKYVVRDGPTSAAHATAGGPKVEFDCITEMTFDSTADYQAMLAALGDPAVAEPLLADEMKLFDRDATVIYVIDEVSTDVKRT